MGTRSARFSRVVLAPLAVAVIAAAWLGAASADDESPQEFIDQMTAGALVILRDDSLSTTAKATRLENELGGCCDFATTAKLVAARNWRSFSPEERQEFVALFRDYLIATYRKNIDSYGGETIEIAGGRDEKFGDYTVFTRIKRDGGQAPVIVNYRLRKNAEGSWRVIDIVAEGISMISNLRSQFQEVYSRGGVQGLMKEMRKKITDQA